MVPSASLLLSLLLACTPAPKNVGDDDLETVVDDDSGEPLDPDDPLWSHVYPADTIILGIAGMPDGGVAAVEHRLEPWEQRIIRYAPDGSEIWRVDPGSWYVGPMVALADGGLLLGGSTRGGDGRMRATVWQLSPAGAIEAEHLHETLGEQELHTMVVDLATHGTRAAYLVRPTLDDASMASGELFVVDLDLVPQWSWSGFVGDPSDVAVVPSGEILTLEPHSLADGTDLMRTFDVSGALVAEEVVTRGSFAQDEPLVKLEVGNAGLERLVGLAGTVFDEGLAQDPLLGPRQVTHGHGVAAVKAHSRQISLVQLDGAGNLLRDTLLPAPMVGVASPVDVVIAPDGSVYICGHEDDDSVPSMPRYGFLLKLPPPA